MCRSVARNPCKSEKEKEEEKEKEKDIYEEENQRETNKSGSLEPREMQLQVKEA